MKPKTVVVDGLEFVVPTWDREAKRWAEDPETSKRVLTGLRKAVPNHEALAREALAATGDGTCLTFWGSHGCSLTAGHEGLHVCGTPGDLCSAGLSYGSDNALILWWATDDETGFTLSEHCWRWFK